MKTPEEKAKELVDRFLLEPIDGLHKYPMCFDTAKQCALICVNEILDNFGIENRFYTAYSTLEYYQQVKTEIKKL